MIELCSELERFPALNAPMRCANDARRTAGARCAALDGGSERRGERRLLDALSTSGSEGSSLSEADQCSLTALSPSSEFTSTAIHSPRSRGIIIRYFTVSHSIPLLLLYIYIHIHAIPQLCFVQLINKVSFSCGFYFSLSTS